MLVDGDDSQVLGERVGGVWCHFIYSWEQTESRAVFRRKSKNAASDMLSQSLVDFQVMVGQLDM